MKVYEGKFIYLTKVYVACDLITALSSQLRKAISPQLTVNIAFPVASAPVGNSERIT